MSQCGASLQTDWMNVGFVPLCSPRPLRPEVITTVRRLGAIHAAQPAITESPAWWLKITPTNCRTACQVELTIARSALPPPAGDDYVQRAKLP